MKKYKLCTIHEFAGYLAEIIIRKGKIVTGGRFTAPLPNYDFAIATTDTKGKSLEKLPFL